LCSRQTIELIDASRSSSPSSTLFNWTNSSSYAASFAAAESRSSPVFATTVVYSDILRIRDSGFGIQGYRVASYQSPVSPLPDWSLATGNWQLIFKIPPPAPRGQRGRALWGEHNLHAIILLV